MFAKLTVAFVTEWHDGVPGFFRGSPIPEHTSADGMGVRMRVRYTGVLAAMHILYRKRADTRVRDFSQKRVPRCPNADVQDVCTLS